MPTVGDRESLGTVVDHGISFTSLASYMFSRHTKDQNERLTCKTQGEFSERIQVNHQALPPPWESPITSTAQVTYLSFPGFHCHVKKKTNENPKKGNGGGHPEVDQGGGALSARANRKKG